MSSFSGGYTPTVRPADAGSTGSFLRLTTQAGNELNTVVFNRTAIGTFGTVVATFDLRMTPGTRADGMGFALLWTARTGCNSHCGI